MQHNVNLNWEEKMSFTTEIMGHKVAIDAKPEMGGDDKGPSPKPFMLLALAGCTGMDVISILRKMKIEPEDFRVEVSGKLSEEHPKQYISMHVKYFFKGENLKKDKLKKAVDLSEEKYCGVSALYKKAIPLSAEIIIE